MLSAPLEALRPYLGLDITMRIGTTMLATTTFWERCSKSGAGEPSNTMGRLSRQTPQCRPETQIGIDRGDGTIKRDPLSEVMSQSMMRMLP
jgi:hypothetical protein